MEPLEEFHEYKIIYPSYIDSTLRLSQGRKIAMQYAVERPTVKEIELCLKKLQFEYIVENDKYYSRDILKKGRVKVKFFRENGSPAISNITTKKQLLVEVAKLVARLSSRNEPERAAEQTSTKSSRKKKKGKGKRR